MVQWFIGWNFFLKPSKNIIKISAELKINSFWSWSIDRSQHKNETQPKCQNSLIIILTPTIQSTFLPLRRFVIVIMNDKKTFFLNKNYSFNQSSNLLSMIRHPTDHPTIDNPSSVVYFFCLISFYFFFLSECSIVMYKKYTCFSPMVVSSIRWVPMCGYDGVKYFKFKKDMKRREVVMMMMKMVVRWCSIFRLRRSNIVWILFLYFSSISPLPLTR